MGADIQLQGARELIAQFEALPQRIADNVMSGALYAGASLIRDEARKNVPILDLEKWGGPHEPGELLQAIVARRSRSRSRDQVIAKVGITYEAFYGHYVEFGTRHARAWPFMRPAYDSKGAEAAQEVVNYAKERFEAGVKP